MSSKIPPVFFLIIIGLSSIICRPADNGASNESSKNTPTSSESELASSGTFILLQQPINIIQIIFFFIFSDAAVKQEDTSVSTTSKSPGLEKIPKGIYNYGLKPIGKLLYFITTPFRIIGKLILKIFGKIMNPFLHIFGIYNFGGIISNIITNASNMLANYVTNIGAILSAIFDILSESHDEETHSRARRSISEMVGSVAHIGTLPVRIPLRIVERIGSIPFRFVSGIFDAIFYPFRAIYRFITWPYRVVFGSNDDDDNNDKSKRSISDSIDGMIGSFFSNMSDTTQDAIIQGLSKCWQTIKTSILPPLDNFLMNNSKSNLLPEMAKTYIERFHKMYRLAHLFNML